MYGAELVSKCHVNFMLIPLQFLHNQCSFCVKICSGVHPIHCSGAHPIHCSGAHPIHCSGAHPIHCSGAHPIHCSGAHPIHCSGAHHAIHCSGAHPIHCSGADQIHSVERTQFRVHPNSLQWCTPNSLQWSMHTKFIQPSLFISATLDLAE